MFGGDENAKRVPQKRRPMQNSHIWRLKAHDSMGEAHANENPKVPMTKEQEPNK